MCKKKKKKLCAYVNVNKCYNCCANASIPTAFLIANDKNYIILHLMAFI